MVLKGRQIAVLVLGVVLAGAVAVYATTKGCAALSPSGGCFKDDGGYWVPDSDMRPIWFTIAVVVFIVAVILALSPWARGTDTKG